VDFTRLDAMDCSRDSRVGEFMQIFDHICFGLMYCRVRSPASREGLVRPPRRPAQGVGGMFLCIELSFSGSFG
jgi:hypothetical protein